MKAITNVNLVLPDRIMEKGVLIFSDKILQLQQTEDINCNQYNIIDGKGCYLTPGFIDIHIHGAGGYDTMDEEALCLEYISKAIIKTGVTSFLPTTMTMAPDIIKNALNNIRDQKGKTSGAQIIGAHVEGPFINPKYKGAQPEEYIQKPSYHFFKNYLDIIKIITFAPEMQGSENFMKAMNGKGIVLSAGHTGASYQDIEKAMYYGLKHSIHLFNGMIGLHHRNPGIVGAILTSDMTCELIADKIHLNPAILKLVTLVKDLENIILITDSMRAAGLDEGIYSLGGQKVTVKNGNARLENGSLAGSILNLNTAIRNMINVSDLSLNHVINMVTINPARLLNIDHRVGELKKGLQADFNLLDKNLQIKNVYIKGEEKYSCD